MRAIPVYALSGCGIALAIVGTWTAKLNPEGLTISLRLSQTLANLVDDWTTDTGKMYWADKAIKDSEDGGRYAGTSSFERRGKQDPLRHELCMDQEDKKGNNVQQTYGC
jgi:hypothetical protein